jgi:hypothetical protein
MEKTLVRFLQATALPLALILGQAFPQGSSGQTVHDLIERLASPNKKPDIVRGDRDDTDFVYPPDYDHAAQKRVEEAWSALLARGSEALPALVQSIEDRRYSYTFPYRYGGGNLDVGHVCAEIFRKEIQVYEWFVPYEGPPWKPRFVPGVGMPGGLKPKVPLQWWEGRPKKDLHTLQIEAVEWAADHERTLGLPKEEESAVLACLDAVLKRLKSSDKPILVGRDGKFLGNDAKLFKENQDRLDRLEKKQDAERSGRLKTRKGY